MNFNNFTTKSQQAVSEARNLAVANNNQQIENAHLLKGGFIVDENIFPHILKKIGVNLSVFNQALDSIILSYPKVSGGQEQLSRNAQLSLDKALSISKKMNDDFVSLVCFCAKCHLHHKKQYI